jgi:hypothetical protein
MSKAPKRPRDLNQWAKRMVDIATGDVSDQLETIASTRASKAGSKGGPRENANAFASAAI